MERPCLKSKYSKNKVANLRRKSLTENTWLTPHREHMTDISAEMALWCPPQSACVPQMSSHSSPQPYTPPSHCSLHTRDNQTKHAYVLFKKYKKIKGYRGLTSWHVLFDYAMSFFIKMKICIKSWFLTSFEKVEASYFDKQKRQSCVLSNRTPLCTSVWFIDSDAFKPPHFLT